MPDRSSTIPVVPTGSGSMNKALPVPPPNRRSYEINQSSEPTSQEPKPSTLPRPPPRVSTVMVTDSEPQPTRKQTQSSYIDRPKPSPPLGRPPQRQNSVEDIRGTPRGEMRTSQDSFGSTGSSASTGSSSDMRAARQTVSYDLPEIANYGMKTTRNFVAPTTVFHVPIDQVKLAGKIPAVVEQTITYLETRGVTEEGILRLAGNNTEIKQLRDQFDKGPYPDLTQCKDPNNIAGLLKLYLRELPKPILLMTRGLKQCLGASEEEAIPVLIEELNNIPEVNYETLKRLFGFLSTVAAHAEQNRMGSSNLAIVFQPTLQMKSELLIDFIEHYAEIFVK